MTYTLRLEMRIEFSKSLFLKANYPCPSAISFIFQLRLSITSDEVRRMSIQRDQRALRLVLAMNLAYLICWSPYAILCVTHLSYSKE